jgi:hypothetical protein
MLELNAVEYLWIGGALRHWVMAMATEEDQTREMSSEYRKKIAATLTEIAGKCELLELPVSKSTAEHWEKELSTGPSRTYQVGQCAIEEVERTIINELRSTVFFYVSRERSLEFQKMLAEARGLWDRPWSVALGNLDHARFCYRAEEFTASVFHSMRAAEKVLTTVARSLSLDTRREQWQTLIERIENAVREFDKLPGGPGREHKQTFYSEVAMQLRYVKNAWRNHVMHARSVYEEKDAREIWWHIKRIVEKASSELEEELEV